MFGFVFTNGFDEDDRKYYGPYVDLETCLALAPALVRKCLSDAGFEDEYGPEEDAYDSDKDLADVVKEYDDKHKDMFPYCIEKATYGIPQETVDAFYITEATLIKMLREHKFYNQHTAVSKLSDSNKRNNFANVVF